MIFALLISVSGFYPVVLVRDMKLLLLFSFLDSRQYPPHCHLVVKTQMLFESVDLCSVM